MSFKKKISVGIVFGFMSSFAIFQNCAPPSSSFDSNSMEEGTLVLPSKDPIVDVQRVEKVEVSPLVANKTLTTNKLLAIFGSSLTHVASRNIAYQGIDFGARSSIYDRLITTDCATNSRPETVCDTTTTLATEITHNVGLNIRREAWRLQTCHAAVKNNTSLLFALKKINSAATVSAPPAINEENLNKAFLLFFKSRAPASPQVVDSLGIAAEDQDAKIDQWRSVFLSLCLSPHWQVL